MKSQVCLSASGDLLKGMVMSVFNLYTCSLGTDQFHLLGFDFVHCLC